MTCNVVGVVCTHMPYPIFAGLVSVEAAACNNIIAVHENLKIIIIIYRVHVLCH